MCKLLATLALALVAGIPAGAASAAATLDKAYLLGQWSLQGSERCKADGAEHIEFRADDTLTLGRGGPADAAGFFELTGNRLQLHLVASPHRISGDLPDYEGSFLFFDHQ
jgi:hypothetical protein